MGAKYEIKGMKELKEMLGEVGKVTDKAAKKGLYDGAAIIAKALDDSVDGIQTEPFAYAPPGHTRLPSPEEVEAIRGKAGISRMKRAGTKVKLSIGFGGYGDVAGNQKAAALIARAINKGTSFMRKQNFANKAVSAARHPAQEAVVATATVEIEKIIGDKD